MPIALYLFVCTLTFCPPSLHWLPLGTKSTITSHVGRCDTSLNYKTKPLVCWFVQYISTVLSPNTWYQYMLETIVWVGNYQPGNKSLKFRWRIELGDLWWVSVEYVFSIIQSWCMYSTHQTGNRNSLQNTT